MPTPTPVPARRLGRQGSCPPNSALPRTGLEPSVQLLFEDTGELLPDGKIIAPHRPSPTRGLAVGSAA